MKILPVLILTGLLLCCKVYSQPVLQYGHLRVEGPFLKGQNNEIVVLKGVSLGWHNWWYKFYTPETVKELSEVWKCSVIRVAMGVDVDSGYIDLQEKAIEIIQPVIDEAIRANIYVIVDWHTHDIHFKEAEKFFTLIAEQYGEYPHIIYEIFNEPDNESWLDIKKYSVDLISAIRNKDPDNLILIGTPKWSQDVDLVAANPLEGFDNIMYTLHFYAASHREELRKKLKTAVTGGVPVFISECAPSESDGDGVLNISQMGKWLRLLDKKKISRVIWSVSDKPESSAMLVPGADAYNWSQSELTEAGKYALTVLGQEKQQKRLKIDRIAGILLLIIMAAFMMLMSNK